MYRKIPQQQIDIETQPGYRPPAIDTGITILPLSALGDREFELLAYLLVKKEIEAGRYSGISDIALMQGVAERGRDCVLYHNGVVCGLIQCKKYVARLSKPQIIKEIIKFVLFATLDQKILPNPDKFEYKIYVSNDLTEPAINLVFSFNKEIDLEISSGNISKYILELVDEYESFSQLKNNLPEQQVINILKRIKVSASNATDLSSRIYKEDHILKTFFNVQTVISIADADKVVRKAMDDYGLKLLTDNDLKNLQQRISDANAEHRINLGLADFFGFSIEFFRHLNKDTLKEILDQVAKVRSHLDIKLLEFIQSEINEHIYSDIIVKLLHTGKIHPFSVSIAAPYLFKRLSKIVAALNLPTELTNKLYPETLLSKDELIRKTSEYCFSISEKIMNGDYSSLVGDEETVQFKIHVYKHMHQGFSSIEDAKKRFALDKEIIVPELDKIEEIIKGLFSKTRTIVIKDGSFFGNNDQLEGVLKTITSIDTKQG